MKGYHILNVERQKEIEYQVAVRRTYLGQEA